MRCRISEGKTSLSQSDLQAPPKPTEAPTQIIPRKTLDVDIDSLEQDINVDFEENVPHKEGVISEIYQRPDNLYFQEPPELQSQIDTGKLA